MSAPVNVIGSTAPAASGRRVPKTAPRVARVAVLGASGYSGQEFIRLGLAHPGLALAALCSRESAGRSAADLVPGLDPRAVASPPVVDVAGLAALLDAGGFDTLVVALPHGAWREIQASHPALALGPERVLDLSSDHRDGSAGAAGGEPWEYGLPEAFRDRLIGTTRIANPGCYPTAAALALLPAAEAGWLSGPIMVNALSGVSGAGRAATLRTSFVELEGGASLYKAGTEHGHVAEMERTLARVLGAGASACPIGFAPHLVPMARGILLTASAPLASPIAPEEALLRYRRRFEGEPFVNVLATGQWPETRAVRGSNRCDLAVTTLHGGRTLLAAAAIDNLVKGAAGQALQNLNLMLGWPEDLALPRNGAPW